MIKTFLLSISAVFSFMNKLFSFLKIKRKRRENAVNKTTSNIGKGHPFIILLLILLTTTGCGYIYTISVPMTFDPNDFCYLDANNDFIVPKDGYYFSNDAMEKYIRSKIAEYEIRKMGFFHKEGE